VLKKIYIIIDNKTTEYDYTQEIKIDITSKIITTQTIIVDFDKKIQQLHSNLKLNYGRIARTKNGSKVFVWK
jgi:hypothetical protein